MNSKTKLTNPTFPGWEIILLSPNIDYKPWIDTFNYLKHFLECFDWRE